MASRLNPYLIFSGNAREAMEFYASVLGGELTLSTFGELGGPDAATPDNIMHGQLVSDRGYWLMGADSAPDAEGTPENSPVSISGDEGDAIRGYFEALSDGGQIAVPLEKQMWGDEFGMLTDRFGVTWMVNIGQPGS
jgi:PhnB protein